MTSLHNWRWYCITYFFLLLSAELSGHLPDAPFKDLPLRIIVLISTATSIFLTISYHLYTFQQSEKRLSQLQVDSERFRVQRQLTQDLAHDLRTPLSTLQTSAYLIRKKVERNLPINDHVNKLESQAKRLNGLIDDLFEMTLLDMDDKKKTLLVINLVNIIQECIKNADTHALTRSIMITFDYDIEAEFHTIGDILQLRRVFDNLIENAIHYGRDKGLIEIKLHADEINNIITIKDDGIGIASEHQDKVFERFYRVDSARTIRDKQGTGIGLNAVQRIIQFHGGDIQLESQVNIGSTFTVILPSINYLEVMSSLS